MKKIIRNTLLVLMVAALAAALAFASGETTLISLSYLNGTYDDQLTASLEEQAEALYLTYEEALEKLNQKVGLDSASGWNFTDGFEMIYPLENETVTLSAGSGLFWFSGTGSASTVLIDVTTGTELAAEDQLTPGHRYLTDQDTVITAFSDSGCAAEGIWKTDATGTAPEDLPFKDVTYGDWYYDAVKFVEEYGLFNGVSANEFEPDTAMSRAMLVTVLYRLAGEPEITGTTPFTDVNPDAWYMPGVLWAYQTGIVNGSTETTFSPDDNVTREQIAVMLYRYASYYEYDVSDREVLSGFPDWEKVDSYAEDALSWAVAIGLIRGNTDGTLNPVGDATRAEVATMLQRFVLWIEP